MTAYRTELSPQQVINRLVAQARREVRLHAPRAGRCPICRTSGCEARRVALDFLATYDPPAFTGAPMCPLCAIRTVYQITTHPDCERMIQVDGGLPVMCRCPVCHSGR